MMTLLREVTRSGTGAAASQLKHPLGGKTGTTNDFTDAWFIGFSPSVTCGTWVGFDDRQTLGEKETGAKAALPIWMDFMRAAIADKPDEQFPSSAQPVKPLLEAPPIPGAPNSPTLANPQKSPEDANSADTDAAPEAELPDAQPPAADTGAKTGDTPQAAGSATTPDDAAKPAVAPAAGSTKPATAKPAAPAGGASRPSDNDESTAVPAAHPGQSAPVNQQL
jgi:penicillin-binding protein 1A